MTIETHRTIQNVFKKQIMYLQMLLHFNGIFYNTKSRNNKKSFSFVLIYFLQTVFFCLMAASMVYARPGYLGLGYPYAAAIPHAAPLPVHDTPEVAAAKAAHFAAYSAAAAAAAAAPDTGYYGGAYDDGQYRGGHYDDGQYHEGLYGDDGQYREGHYAGHYAGHYTGPLAGVPVLVNGVPADTPAVAAAKAAHFAAHAHAGGHHYG
jgi:hypothetical protein